MSSLQVGYVEANGTVIPIFATAAALGAWDRATGAWQTVSLLGRYFPLPHPLLPARSPNNSGEVAAYPAPEGAALVASGHATAVGTASPQQGTYTA